MKRRSFIRNAGITFLLSGIDACKERKIPGRILGASASAGHRVRDLKEFTPPKPSRKTGTVIIGAGVSGLSAARHLYKNGQNDFILFDLENTAGGNARWGENEISAFPLGAHYIPIPNNSLFELTDFLSEIGVINKFTGDLPEYNETYLCFDPEERLYINGKWQDGLVPHFGLNEDEIQNTEAFLSTMQTFRNSRGNDGKYAFDIPVNASSKDPVFTRLDKMTMKAWMNENEYVAQPLHWYVDYCCRDDFGMCYDKISAWMGIHYFAARRGRASNADYNDVLTWPEGNGFLVKNLMNGFSEKVETGKVVLNIHQNSNGCIVTYSDTANNESKAIECNQCIVSVPQFVAARLFEDEKRLSLVHQHFEYVPWMVANLRVSALTERSGAGPSWDNVIYGSTSLGYIDNTHQLLKQQYGSRNITYYLPLTGGPAKQERKNAANRSHSEWVNMITDDLIKVHPNIEYAIEKADIILWGHAMALPGPGFIHGNVREQLSKPLGNIHFAHTDLAGASIFEEAFYQGIAAAKSVIKNMSHV